MPAIKSSLSETLDSLFGLPYTALKKIEKGTFIFQNKQEVTFDRDFYAGVYPVTQELYRKIMDSKELYERVIAATPSFFKGKHRPVEWVSWNDVQIFLEKLNEEAKGKHNDGLTFRLPTEAMWEYCARNIAWEIEGKVDTKRDGSGDFSGSHVLDEVGWYDENSRKQTQPVGLKEPNLLGLYDMSGNVWEWCQDYYAEDIGSGYVNGFEVKEVTKEKFTRVVRGGCWSNDGVINGRLLARRRLDPDIQLNVIGFRLFRY